MLALGAGHPLLSRPLFHAEKEGRKIVAGFSYYQQIDCDARTDVWFPDSWPDNLPDTMEWAAIRTIQILRESSDFSVYCLEAEDLTRALQNMQYMRADGYLITLISLGTYTQDKAQDDLAILDKKLQEEIAQLISFLYLAELSENKNAQFAQKLAKPAWHYADTLPHIAKAMGERQLFTPERERRREKTFFRLLEKLPAKHIVQETAVGLTLPEVNKDYYETYLLDPEYTYGNFQNFLTSFFRGLDPNVPATRHMRTYADNLNVKFASFDKRCLQALRL